VATTAKFQKGDLVKACYTFYDYYYPDDDDDLFYPWNGIVVDLYYDEDYFGEDAIYDVLCTDGTQRLFAEWELLLIQR
tara:strand:- start:56 stop:289 length:234 start_codon:yes stop_codon:yes gene_type:complete